MFLSQHMLIVTSLNMFLKLSRTRYIRGMATLIGSTITHLQPQELTFTLLWGNIAGKLWGNSDSEKKILAIHGFLENAGSFDRLIPLLFAHDIFAKKYSILAIDLPGHGFSSARPDGVPNLLINYVIDIKRLINLLGWKKILLMGHSLGGSISALYSTALGDQVERLILIDSGSIFAVKVDAYLDLLKTLLEDTSKLYIIPDTCKVYPTMDAIMARILEGNPRLNEQAAEALAIRGTKKVENGFTFTRDIRLKSRNPIYFLSETNDGLFYEAVKHLTMPVLCILAPESHTLSVKAKFFESKVPKNFEVVHVAGNHHVHTNTPETVAPIILEFLN